MVQAEAVLNMPPTGIKTYVHKSAQGQTVNNTIVWFYFIIIFFIIKENQTINSLFSYSTTI